MKIGQKISEEGLILQGWKFACTFADCEVWKNDNQRILWHRKTGIIQNVY